MGLIIAYPSARKGIDWEAAKQFLAREWPRIQAGLVEFVAQNPEWKLGKMSCGTRITIEFVPCPFREGGIPRERVVPVRYLVLSLIHGLGLRIFEEEDRTLTYRLEVDKNTTLA